MRSTQPVFSSKADDIIRDVCDATGMTREQLVGHTRFAHVVYARHTAMYLIYQQTSLSLPQIGRLFDRDHTTVLHAVRRVRQRMAA